MELLEKLSNAYPDANCELEFGNEFQLLVSVILSAQCTDKRVNTVTRELFASAPAPRDFCEMDISELENRIKSCGLYKNKAANIKACCKILVDKYGGEVPRTMDELLTLPGVGRKTANVMLSVAFGEPAIAVDTHVFRVAHRLGLSDGKTPDEVERDLNKAFDKKDYRDVHFLFIRHGRDCCYARKPNCEDCPVHSECREYSLHEQQAGVINVHRQS